MNIAHQTHKHELKTFIIVDNKRIRINPKKKKSPNYNMNDVREGESGGGKGIMKVDERLKKRDVSNNMTRGNLIAHLILCVTRDPTVIAETKTNENLWHSFDF